MEINLTIGQDRRCRLPSSCLPHTGQGRALGGAQQSVTALQHQLRVEQSQAAVCPVKTCVLLL